MSTYYLEGRKKEDHMVVEGLTASEATCYFDVFYGEEPRHLKLVPDELPFLTTDRHRAYKVILPHLNVPHRRERDVEGRDDKDKITKGKTSTFH